jgi:hypothetical protein
MRPEGLCLGRKTFSPTFIFGAPKLFTAGCGELLLALLASGSITLETVSVHDKGIDKGSDRDTCSRANQQKVGRSLREV